MALLGKLIDPLGLFGGSDKKQKEAAKKAQEEEMKRQQQVRREEQQREMFATAEGEGIQEGASISLGFDEDEDDLFDNGSGTGLVI